jgi:membrane associated rhomboid family serine protease
VPLRHGGEPFPGLGQDGRVQSPKVLFSIAAVGFVLAVGAFVVFLSTSLPSEVAVVLTGVGWGAAIYGTIMGVVRLRERKADQQP